MLPPRPQRDYALMAPPFHCPGARHVTVCSAFEFGDFLVNPRDYAPEAVVVIAFRRRRAGGCDVVIDVLPNAPTAYSCRDAGTFWAAGARDMTYKF